MEMILATGVGCWPQIEFADLQRHSLYSEGVLTGLHAAIYLQRDDVGAVAITSPKGARLLARLGGRLPSIFDEQARHIGPSADPMLDEDQVRTEIIGKALRNGVNATLLGERLLCLGMTCDRALFNTELYEKCARAYVLAKASGHRIKSIPAWVRLIANHRLLKDERKAAASYRSGRIPEAINSY